MRGEYEKGKRDGYAHLPGYKGRAGGECASRSLRGNRPSPFHSLFESSPTSESLRCTLPPYRLSVVKTHFTMFRLSTAVLSILNATGASGMSTERELSGVPSYNSSSRGDFTSFLQENSSAPISAASASGFNPYENVSFASRNSTHDPYQESYYVSPIDPNFDRRGLTINQHSIREPGASRIISPLNAHFVNQHKLVTRGDQGDPEKVPRECGLRRSKARRGHIGRRPKPSKSVTDEKLSYGQYT